VQVFVASRYLPGSTNIFHIRTLFAWTVSSQFICTDGAILRNAYDRSSEQPDPSWTQGERRQALLTNSYQTGIDDVVYLSDQFSPRQCGQFSAQLRVIARDLHSELVRQYPGTRRSKFDIYGLDILCDRESRLWMLELNVYWSNSVQAKPMFVRCMDWLEAEFAGKDCVDG
jgi:hypothetical protein